MPQIYGKTSRVLPTVIADASQAQPRLSRYGEQYIVPVTAGRYAMCDEGQYFKAINPTPGTAISQTIQTTFSATNAAFTMRNSDSASGKRIYMDYLRLVVGTIGASATSSQFLVSIDNTTRYSSGGTALTAVNSNMDVTVASVAVCHFGALTCAAESGSVRRIARGVCRSSIFVVQDEIFFNFGAGDTAGGNLGGTTALRAGIPIGPVILGPVNHSLVIHIWNPANAATAPAYEVEAGWWER